MERLCHGTPLQKLFAGSVGETTSTPEIHKPLHRNQGDW